MAKDFQEAPVAVRAALMAVLLPSRARLRVVSAIAAVTFRVRLPARQQREAAVPVGQRKIWLATPMRLVVRAV
jgi:hypothetical protein